MIYKAVMSSGDSVLIESEEDMMKFLGDANNPNKKLILTKHGLINTSFLVSIVPHKEKLAEIRDHMGIGKTKEEAISIVLPPSPFARILSEKMQMLTPQSRTAAQEESSKTK